MRKLAVALLSSLAVGSVFATATEAVPGPVQVPSRALVDRPDDTRGHQIHVVYLVARDGVDRRLDVDGRPVAALGAMQGWLASQAEGRRWRFDTHRGRLDVTFVRGEQDSATYNNNNEFAIRDELKRRGFDQERTKKRYLVLFDAAPDKPSTSCGSAEYPVYPARTYAGVDQGPRLGGSTAVVYMRADPRCNIDDYGTAAKPGFFPLVALHELVHLEGVVPPGAPHACTENLGGHVCTVGPLVFQPQAAALDPEHVDLMFPVPTVPLADASLDRGQDDYYNSPHALLALEDSIYLIGGRRSGGSPQRPEYVRFTSDSPDQH